jgi:hypothetical protein
LLDSSPFLPYVLQFTWTIFYFIHPWICIWVTISCRTYFEFRMRSWRFHMLGILTLFLGIFFMRTCWWNEIFISLMDSQFNNKM